MRSPEVAARFASLGIEPGTGSPAEFAAMVAKDTARWSALGKQLNIKLD
jgi:tripartite-type tricarboxylate transporter receptor subunit TctC